MRSTMLQHTGTSIGPARVMRHLGAVGFLFFLVKGLLWLTVPTMLIWLGWSS